MAEEERRDEQVRRIAKRATEQPREALERITAASTETAETMRDCCSKVVKGMQDYQNRYIEFAQANANHSFELVQRLMGVKSPSEFVVVSSDHVRRQWDMLADQAKQLTDLVQNMTFASAEPLRSGFERVFKQAA
jgi:phasin